MDLLGSEMMGDAGGCGERDFRFWIRSSVVHAVLCALLIRRSRGDFDSREKKVSRKFENFKFERS